MRKIRFILQLTGATNGAFFWSRPLTKEVEVDQTPGFVSLEYFVNQVLFTMFLLATLSVAIYKIGRISERNMSAYNQLWL
jgi:hypothetical protein